MRRRIAVSVLLSTALMAIGVASAHASSGAPWGSGVPLSAAEVKSAISYPGVVTVYSAPESTHRITVNRVKHTAKTWYVSYSGDVVAKSGREIAQPYYGGGQQWSSAAIARIAFAKEFTPSGDFGAMQVVSGAKTGDRAIFLWAPDQGPQYASGTQVSGRYLAHASCGRPYTAVSSDGKPTAMTQTVRTALVSCVTKLLNAQAAKMPAR